jgi:hypothetical protein
MNQKLIEPMVSASSCAMLTPSINRYQEQINNIPNMTHEEIDQILTGNKYYSNSFFDDGKTEYIKLLRKKYGLFNIEKLLSKRLLNNHVWILSEKKIRTKKRCKDLEFIFDHQIGLMSFVLVHLNDKIYFAWNFENNCIEIHAENPLDLLDFVKEQNLKIDTRNKKEEIENLEKTITNKKLLLEFLK